MAQSSKVDAPIESFSVRAASEARRRWQRFTGIDEIGVLIAIFVLGFLLSVSTDTFLRSNNLLQVARQASYYGIMAVGMVFVLSMGDVDLSVGSILMLVNIVTAIALREGLPVPLAILAGLSTGAVCGLVNGSLSVILRIPTIIVTLGTMSVFRGAALVISKATPISQFSKDTLLFTLGGGRILGVPTSVVIMILVGVVGFILFNRTAFGRRVQAIGSNLQAARFSGIRIVRHRILVMTLMGVFSAIAGIAALAFLQAGDPATGPGFELFVIASAIIGGTALTGGSGSIPGGILGALIIAMIRNGLVLIGLSAYWSTAATGVVIIAAVAIDYFVKRR
jgi:ribose transport system permease protein